MDRITAIALAQWRGFWRRFRRAGNLNAGNQGILLIISVLLLVRYLQSLHRVASELPKGNARLLESLLMGIFLVWLFPLATTRLSISPRKLLHWPLTPLDLFAVKIVTLFIPPFSWIILVGSLGICYPLLRAKNPLAGVAAALLFVLWSALVGLTIAHLLPIKFWRRMLFAALLLAGVGIFFLVNRDGVAGLVALSAFLPSALVARAATGNQSLLAVGELSLLTTVTLLAGFWSFKQSLETTQSRRSQKFTSFNSSILAGPVGGLAAKDFRYFRRLLDPYLGVLAAALGTLYLVAAQEPSIELFQLCVLIVFLPNTPLAFNSFGLETRAGLDRIRLMPLNGSTVLLSKNLAFVMIMAVQLAPMVLLASWRLGLLSGLLGIVEAAALSATFLVWGNWMSLNHPIKMQFFQFSNSSGLIVEALAGLMLGSLPGMISIYLLHTEGLSAAWKLILVLLVSLSIYLAALVYFSSRFEQKQDRILNAIS